MIAGYVRVSTPSQDEQRQIDRIQQDYDIDEFYADVEHGDVLTGREGLDSLIRDSPDIDTVVVDELSRFGRTISVRKTIDNIRSNGVTVEVVDQGLTLTPDREDMDMASGVTYDIYTRQAQEELRQIRRRTRQGMTLAKEKGKHVGNVPTGFEVSDRGFLQPSDDFEAVNEMVREINRGREKKRTARFFGFNPQSIRSILRTTRNEDYPYDARYVGDEEWRRRRVAVENGDREVVPLGDEVAQ